MYIDTFRMNGFSTTAQIASLVSYSTKEHKVLHIRIIDIPKCNFSQASTIILGVI